MHRQNASRVMASYDTPLMASSGRVSMPSSLIKKFGDEARNVRFALNTDGMNLLGDLNSSLTIYNLPPYLCQKRRYLLLTMIISSPKEPCNDIDVFLEPLMEDMKML